MSTLTYPDGALIRSGDRVRLQGVSAASFNGAMGFVEKQVARRFLASRVRELSIAFRAHGGVRQHGEKWLIKLDDGREASFEAENLSSNIARLRELRENLDRVGTCLSCKLCLQMGQGPIRFVVQDSELPRTPGGSLNYTSSSERILRGNVLRRELASAKGKEKVSID